MKRNRILQGVLRVGLAVVLMSLVAACDSGGSNGGNGGEDNNSNGFPEPPGRPGAQAVQDTTAVAAAPPAVRLPLHEVHAAARVSSWAAS